MRQLKDNPRTRHIPVIVLSVLDASVGEHPVIADAYLIKPVNMETLTGIIEQLLKTAHKAETG